MLPKRCHKGVLKLKTPYVERLFVVFGIIPTRKYIFNMGYLEWFLVRFCGNFYAVLSPLSPLYLQSVVESVVTFYGTKKPKKRKIYSLFRVSQSYIFFKLVYFCSFIFNDVLYCSASGTSINSTDLSKFFITTAFISSSVTLKNSLR